MKKITLALLAGTMLMTGSAVVNNNSIVANADKTTSTSNSDKSQQQKDAKKLIESGSNSNQINIEVLQTKINNITKSLNQSQTQFKKAKNNKAKQQAKHNIAQDKKALKNFQNILKSLESNSK